MEEFFKWARIRFPMGNLMHLADVENKTLKILMFDDGPSRNEFIKFLVYKLLLDIELESEDSQDHDLEKIFVSFGLLDKETAQLFLKGSMPTNLHIMTWRRILEAFIPTTAIRPQWSNYDEMINFFVEKNNSFRLVEKKNFLPPELISKLKTQKVLDGPTETIEDISEKLINIIKKTRKSSGNNDFNSLINNDEQLPNCTSSDFMDLASIKEEIDQYLNISNDNKIISSNSEQLIKMTPQEMVELINKQKLIHNFNLESKINNIYRLYNAEHDLQILANSLAVQIHK